LIVRTKEKFLDYMYLLIDCKCHFMDIYFYLYIFCKNCGHIFYCF